MRLLPVLAACGFLLASGAQAAVIVGDSIGVGLAAVSHLPSVARKSVQILSKASLEMLAEVPRGSTVLVVLGTNDAVGTLRGVDKAIDRFVAAAAARGLKLVWAGPPCVVPEWNRTVRVLDRMLAERLAGRAVYVSLADARYCAANWRGKDGVHFTAPGYLAVWQHIIAADPAVLDNGAAANSVRLAMVPPQTSATGALTEKRPFALQRGLEKGPLSLLPPAGLPPAGLPPAGAVPEDASGGGPGEIAQAGTSVQDQADLGQIRPGRGWAAWSVRRDAVAGLVPGAAQPVVLPRPRPDVQF